MRKTREAVGAQKKLGFVLLRVLAAAALTMSSAWVGPLPAWAGEIVGAVKQVSLVETQLVNGRTATTKVTWAVPDGSQEGDTFSVTFPPQLIVPDQVRSLYTPDGKDVVANVTIKNRVATYKLTSYVKTHKNVHGEDQLTSTFWTTEKPGTVMDVVFTAGTTTFTDAVTVTPFTNNPAAVTKWARWVDPAARPTGWDPGTRILWAVNAPQVTKGFVGTTLTLVDVAGEGQSFDCATVYLATGKSRSGGVEGPFEWLGARATITCTEKMVSGSFVVREGDLDRYPFMMGGSRLTEVGLPSYKDEGRVLVNGTRVGEMTTDVASTASGSGWGTGSWLTDGVSVQKYAITDDPDGGLESADADTAPGRTVPAGAPHRIGVRIVNSGQFPLTSLTVTDSTLVGPPITDLRCDFRPIGGADQSTTFTGSFPVGMFVQCTGTVPAMPGGQGHADTVQVKAKDDQGDTYESTDSYYATTAPQTSTSTTTTSATTSSTTTSAATSSTTSPGSTTTTTTAPRPTTTSLTSTATTASTVTVTVTTTPPSTSPGVTETADPQSSTISSDDTTTRSPSVTDTAAPHFSQRPTRTTTPDTATLHSDTGIINTGELSEEGPRWGWIGAGTLALGCGLLLSAAQLRRRDEGSRHGC